jgi:intein/homing endonuclease
MFTDKFEIEDLGIQEEWVYDIEIEDNHNFFANDILVHNSIYFQFDDVAINIQKQNPKLALHENRDEFLDKCDEFIKTIVMPVIKIGYEELREYVNAVDNRMFMEREVIATCFHPNTIITNINTKIKDLYNSITENPSELINREFTKYCNIPIHSFNETSMKYEEDNIVSVTKKQYCGIMYEFKQDDQIIHVTENHELATNQGNSIIWKKAKDITEDDELIVNG